MDEQIDIPVVSRDETSLQGNVTFPTPTLIQNIVVVLPDDTMIASTKQSYLPDTPILYGATVLRPGDYTISISIQPDKIKEAALIRMVLQINPISTLMLSQMIFGLYRMLGHDVSDVLGYPSVTPKKSVPFYKKAFDNIEQLCRPKDSMAVTDVEAMIKDRDFLHAKLIEAENHIEYLEKELKEYTEEEEE